MPSISPLPKSIQYRPRHCRAAAAAAGPVLTNAPELTLPGTLAEMLSPASDWRTVERAADEAAFLVLGGGAEAGAMDTAKERALRERSAFSHRGEYTLEIGERGIRARGSDPAALRNALETLARIVETEPSEALPACTIRDWPDLAIRGAMLCFHQHHDFMPYFSAGIETLCGPWLEMLAGAKINTLLVEYETHFPWERHPKLRCADAFTKDEVARFVENAGAHGIEIIPLVQTLGHVYHALIHEEYADIAESEEHPQQFCPLKERTHEVVGELIDETLALHPGARYLHLGGDECRQLGVCPDCAAYAAEHGPYMLWAAYYQRLTQAVLERGVTPIVWHDIAFRDPRALAALPDGVVFNYWNYAEHTHGDVPGQLDRLRQAIPPGRILCSPAVRCEQVYGSLHRPFATNFETVRTMAREALRIGALGSLVTDWPDSGIPFLDAVPSILYQGEAAWNASNSSTRRFAEGYARQRFGLDDAERFLDIESALDGPVLCQPGFNTELKSNLNRYVYKPFRLEEWLAREIGIVNAQRAFEVFASLFNRRYRFAEELRAVEELLERATRNPHELEHLRLMLRTGELFTVGGTALLVREILQRDPSARVTNYPEERFSADAARAAASWEPLKEAYRALYGRFSSARQIENHLAMRFPDAVRTALEAYTAPKPPLPKSTGTPSR